MKTNAELQKDVYEELKWDPRIKEGDIGVSVHEGIVTLSGTIPSYAEKWAAEDDAKSVAGVTAVVNKIDVKLLGSLIKDDQDIAQAAVNALKWDVWVPHETVQVLVEKGWVTLSGKVHFDYQKKAVENAVRRLTGVVGVVNKITVEPAIQPNDVHNKIKQALHRHAEEDAKKIHIEVKGGEVVLTGTVRSWDEKTAAEWAALGTAGVHSVRNNVSVKYV